MSHDIWASDEFDDGLQDAPVRLGMEAAVSAPVLRPPTHGSSRDVESRNNSRLAGARTASGALRKQASVQRWPPTDTESRVQRSLQTVKTWSTLGGGAPGGGGKLYAVAPSSASTSARSLGFGGLLSGSDSMVWTALEEEDEEEFAEEPMTRQPATQAELSGGAELPEHMLTADQAISKIWESNLTHHAAKDIIAKFKGQVEEGVPSMQVPGMFSSRYFEGCHMYGEIGDGLLSVRRRLRNIERKMEDNSLEDDDLTDDQGEVVGPDKRLEQIRNKIVELEIKADEDTELMGVLNAHRVSLRPGDLAKDVIPSVHEEEEEETRDKQVWGREKLGTFLHDILVNFDKLNWDQMTRLFKRWVQTDATNTYMLRELLEQIAEQEREAVELTTTSRIKVTDALGGRVVSNTRVLMDFHDRILQEMAGMANKQKLVEGAGNAANLLAEWASNSQKSRIEGSPSIKKFREKMMELREHHMKQVAMSRAIHDRFANAPSIEGAAEENETEDGAAAIKELSSMMRVQSAAKGSWRQHMKTSNLAKSTVMVFADGHGHGKLGEGAPAAAPRRAVDAPHAAVKESVSAFASFYLSRLKNAETKVQYIKTAAAGGAELKKQLRALVRFKPGEEERVRALKFTREELFEKLNELTVPCDPPANKSPTSRQGSKPSRRHSLHRSSSISVEGDENGTSKRGDAAERAANRLKALQEKNAREVREARNEEAKQLDLRDKESSRFMARFAERKESLVAEVHHYYGKEAWVVPEQGGTAEVTFLLNPRAQIAGILDEGIRWLREQDYPEELRRPLSDLAKAASMIDIRIRSATVPKERATLAEKVDQLVGQLRDWCMKSREIQQGAQSGGSSPDPEHAQAAGEVGLTGAQTISILTAEVSEQQEMVSRYGELQDQKEAADKAQVELERLQEEVDALRGQRRSQARQGLSQDKDDTEASMKARMQAKLQVLMRDKAMRDAMREENEKESAAAAAQDEKERAQAEKLAAEAEAREARAARSAEKAAGKAAAAEARAARAAEAEALRASEAEARQSEEKEKAAPSSKLLARRRSVAKKDEDDTAPEVDPAEAAKQKQKEIAKQMKSMGQKLKIQLLGARRQVRALTTARDRKLKEMANLSAKLARMGGNEFAGTAGRHSQTRRKAVAEPDEDKWEEKLKELRNMYKTQCRLANAWNKRLSDASQEPSEPSSPRSLASLREDSSSSSWHDAAGRYSEMDSRPISVSGHALEAPSRAASKLSHRPSKGGPERVVPHPLSFWDQDDAVDIAGAVVGSSDSFKATKPHAPTGSGFVRRFPTSTESRRGSSGNASPAHGSFPGEMSFNLKPKTRKRKSSMAIFKHMDDSSRRPSSSVSSQGRRPAEAGVGKQHSQVSQHTDSRYERRLVPSGGIFSEVLRRFGNSALQREGKPSGKDPTGGRLRTYGRPEGRRQSEVDDPETLNLGEPGGNRGKIRGKLRHNLPSADEAHLKFTSMDEMQGSEPNSPRSESQYWHDLKKRRSTMDLMDPADTVVTERLSRLEKRRRRRQQQEQYMRIAAHKRGYNLEMLRQFCELMESKNEEEANESDDEDEVLHADKDASARKQRALHLLRSCRLRMISRFHSEDGAYRRFSTHSAGMEQEDFMDMAMKLNFYRSEALLMWDTIMELKKQDGKTPESALAALLRGTTELSISSETFLFVMKLTRPIKTLLQLRIRLHRRHKSLPDVFDDWTGKKLCMDFITFKDLLAGVGVPSAEAYTLFEQIAMHNEVSQVKPDQTTAGITRKAFHNVLRHARGIAASFRLQNALLTSATPAHERSAARVSLIRRPGYHLDRARDMFDAFFQQVGTAFPISSLVSVSEFQAAVQRMQMSQEDARAIFLLAAVDEDERVRIEDVVTVSIAGMGHVNNELRAHLGLANWEPGVLEKRGRKRSNFAAERPSSCQSNSNSTSTSLQGWCRQLSKDGRRPALEPSTMPPQFPQFPIRARSKNASRIYRRRKMLVLGSTPLAAGAARPLDGSATPAGNNEERRKSLGLGKCIFVLLYHGKISKLGDLADILPPPFSGAEGGEEDNEGAAGSDASNAQPDIGEGHSPRPATRDGEKRILIEHGHSFRSSCVGDCSSRKTEGVPELTEDQLRRAREASRRFLIRPAPQGSGMVNEAFRRVLPLGLRSRRRPAPHRPQEQCSPVLCELLCADDVGTDGQLSPGRSPPPPPPRPAKRTKAPGEHSGQASRTAGGSSPRSPRRGSSSSITGVRRALSKHLTGIAVDVTTRQSRQSYESILSLHDGGLDMNHEITKLQEWRSAVLRRFKSSLAAAYDALAGSRGAELELNALHAGLSKVLGMSSEAAGQMVMVMSLAEELTPMRFGGFVSVVRFARPTGSLLELRARLVRRHGTVDEALSVLGVSDAGSAVTEEEFKRTMLGVGVTFDKASRLFRAVDAAQLSEARGRVDGQALRLALDQSDVIRWMELFCWSLGGSSSAAAALASEGGGLDQAVESAPDLAHRLSPLGVPAQIAEQAFQLLWRRAPARVTLRCLAEMLSDAFGDSTPSSANFEGLRPEDTAVLLPFATRLSTSYGPVSRAFEGLNLADLLPFSAFEEEVRPLLECNPDECRAIFEHVDRHEQGRVALGDVMDALTAVQGAFLVEEERSTRLQPCRVLEEAAERKGRVALGDVMDALTAVKGAFLVEEERSRRLQPRRMLEEAAEQLRQLPAHESARASSGVVTWKTLGPSQSPEPEAACVPVPAVGLRPLSRGARMEDVQDDSAEAALLEDKSPMSSTMGRAATGNSFRLGTARSAVKTGSTTMGSTAMGSTAFPSPVDWSDSAYSPPGSARPKTSGVDKPSGGREGPPGLPRLAGWHPVGTLDLRPMTSPVKERLEEGPSRTAQSARQPPSRVSRSPRRQMESSSRGASSRGSLKPAGFLTARGIRTTGALKEEGCAARDQASPVPSRLPALVSPPPAEATSPQPAPLGRRGSVGAHGRGPKGEGLGSAALVGKGLSSKPGAGAKASVSGKRMLATVSGATEGAVSARKFPTSWTAR